MPTTTTNLALAKPAGGDKPKNFRSGYNGNMDKIDAAVGGIEAGMAIVAVGDTAPQAIDEGQLVYVRGHSTLATGMYHALDDIASGETLTNVNLAIDTDGGMNRLQEQIDALNSNSDFIYSSAIQDTTGNNYTVLDMSAYRYIVVFAFRYNNCFAVNQIGYEKFKLLGSSGFPSESQFGNITSGNQAGDSIIVRYVSDTSVYVKTVGYGSVYLCGKK